MNPRACGDRRLRELPRERKRVEAAGAPIDKGAEIQIGAYPALGFLRIDIGDVGAAPSPLFGARARLLRRLLGMNALNPGGAPRLRPQAQALDQVEDEIRGSPRETPEPRAARFAERGFDVIRIVFEPGNDLAAVAAGCAISGPLGLEDHDFAARLCKVEGGGQAEVAGANDEDIGADLAGERDGFRRRDRRLLPEVGEASHLSSSEG